MERSTLQTKTVLLQAALTCFAQHGFDGTSMRTIAEKAKRPLSLLSHHFGGKEGLYAEVFSWIFEQNILNMKQAGLPAEGYSPKDKKEAVQFLREQVHTLYSEVAKPPDQRVPFREEAITLWLQEIRAPRDILRPLILVQLAPLTGTIKKCIQVLRPDLDEREVLFVGASILGLVTGHGFMFGTFQAILGEVRPSGSPFQVSEMLVDLCLNGLQGTSKAPARADV